MFLAILIQNFSNATEMVAKEVKEKKEEDDRKNNKIMKKEEKKVEKKKLSEFPFLYDLMQRR